MKLKHAISDIFKVKLVQLKMKKGLVQLIVRIKIVEKNENIVVTSRFLTQ